MAAVHSSSSNKDSSNSNRRNGTASPGGWHFPKSGLGTPDLYYSFSGGSSSGTTAGGHAGSSSSSSMTSQQQQQQQQQAPAWLKPQGSAQQQQSSSANTSTNARSNANTTANAASRSTTNAIKKEEADGDNDDTAAAAGTADGADSSEQATGSKFARDAEEANRTQRALSDPPVRQSPAWIFPSAGFGPHKTHLEQEPNPFEHSFSVKDTDSHTAPHLQFAQAINAGGGGGGGAGNNHYHSGYPSNAYANVNNSYEIGPPRRARSQSPKSAGWQHSGINAGNHFNNPYQDQNHYLAANIFNNSHGQTSSMKPSFLSTPSSELPSFGWTFDQQNPTSTVSGNGVTGSSLFDPTSIRTGLTPGGPLDSSKHSHHLSATATTHHGMQPPTLAGGAPHSPATQALFAMMTNATPGADVAAYNSDQQQQKNTQQQHPLHQHHQAALGDTSRTSSNHSTSSNSQQQGFGNNEAQGMYSQTVPRLNQSNSTGPYNTSQQYMQAQYQLGGNPAYLQQNMPRPLPPRAFDSTQSSEASSSQSVPQIASLQQQQQQRQQGGVGQRIGGTDQNPLYLLSQHAQDGSQQHPPQSIPPNVVQRLQQQPQAGGTHQRHPSDTQVNSHNEDAMLAAAALSGLSTPRPAYVGGPAPDVNVNPGIINTSQPVPNLVQPPLGRQQQQQQEGKLQPPPANLFHTSKTSNSLTKENIKANNKSNAKKGGANASTGTNKRKKGATATPEPTNAAEDGKKVRRTSRRTAASSSNLAEPQSEDDQFERSQSQSQLQPNLYNEDNNNSFNKGDGGVNSDDDDDDMMSNNGSLNGSRDGRGGSQAGDTTGVSPPRKGGRGPKQHFATEEDKRKNFLERNRQAALKCRQRKKQWLSQLQSKVEYLTADNETLQTTVTRLREEVANLRAILGAHGDCQMNVPPGPTGPGGVTSVAAYMHGMQQQGMPPPHQQHPHPQY